MKSYELTNKFLFHQGFSSSQWINGLATSCSAGEVVFRAYETVFHPSYKSIRVVSQHYFLILSNLIGSKKILLYSIAIYKKVAFEGNQVKFNEPKDNDSILSVIFSSLLSFIHLTFEFMS